MIIKIDAATQYQTFSGFGASGAWWAQAVGGWEHIDALSGKPVRDRISELLYNDESGIGLSIYRYNIGGGSALSGNGNIDNPLRRTESFDTDTGYDFSRDKNAVYMMNRAVKDGASEVILFVNSPPERYTKNGWAHTSPDKSFKENLDEKNYPAFAKYCLDVTEHFVKSGVPVKYLSPVNEPMWKWTGGQEGCHYKARSVKKVFRIFADEMKKREALNEVRLSGAENGDIRWYNKSYTRAVLSDKAVRERVDSIDVHSYFYNIKVPFLNDRKAFLRRFKKYMDIRFPGVPIKMSEWTHMKGGRDSSMNSALEMAKIMYEDISILGVTSWQHWIAVSEVDYCDGLIYINMDDKSFETTKRLYVTGNFSKYIKPGSKRIKCDCDDSEVYSLAFICGGKTVIIVVNPADNEKNLSLENLKSTDIKQILTDETHDLYETEVTDTGNILIPKKSVSTIIF